MPTPARIIFVTTDHMRHDCIGAYGNGLVHTPTLDRLAAHGVNFHNCFAQNPLCMPSRASFMTGMYPQQTGVVANGYSLPPEFRPTAAHLFSGLGHRTVHIGKLHLQPHEDHDLHAEPDHAYGFETFMRSESRGCYWDAYMKWLQGRYPEYLDALRTTRPTDPRRLSEDCFGRVIEAPWQASHSGWIADTASRFLHSGFGGRFGEPLFMHLGFHNPHPPLNPTREAFAPYEKAEIPLPPRQAEEWADKPAPLCHMLQSRRQWSDEDFINYRRFFYALVTEMDLALGQLVDLLEQQQALDNTLLVFTSDHGDMCGDHGMTHKGAHFYDAVMRVPLLLHWPAGFGTERRDHDGLIELVDLLPTLLDCCGAAIPPMLMGRSCAGALQDREAPVSRADVFAYDRAGAMLRTRSGKYICYTGSGDEVLFDLGDTHTEVRNVVEDAAYAGALAEMRHRMCARLLEAGRSPLERRYRF